MTRDSDLSDLERRLLGRRQSPDEIARHGWDRHNISPHLSIESDNITVKKVEKSSHKEVALGKVAYTQGVHVFELSWNPGSDKHVAFGIASEDIGVHADSGDYLLGNDDQSIAWELTSHNIIFNGCVIKQMPSSSMAEDTVLAKSLIMVLDMNEGTLLFKAERTFDIAMRGLKHVSESFHVAACLDKHNDQATVKYLGNSDSLSDKHVYVGLPLRFHDTCGKNIVLSANNTVASRVQPRTSFSHATVFSNRQLNEGEMFTVSLKTRDDSKWSGSIVVGVSTVSPLEVNFIDWMPSCEQGKSCLYNGTKIKDGSREIETKTNIDKLAEGSTIGVSRKSGSNRIEFYVNGELETSVKASIGPKEDIYGCVDVYGQAVAVSLLTKDMRKRTDPDIKAQMLADPSKSPARRIFLTAIEDTLKLMTNRDTAAIPRVCKALENNMLYPYQKVTDKQLKQTVADQLARMKSGVIFKSYLQFLRLCDMDSENMSVQCYDAILYTCWAYSNESLLLCREYGDSGLLETLVKDLIGIKDTWTKSPGKKDRARKLIGICHNCCKTTENKTIFYENNFVHVVGCFLNARHDSDIGVSALLTASYVLRPKETACLKTPPAICKAMLSILDEAAKGEPYTNRGYSANELATGITNLCQLEENIQSFVAAGACGALTRMLIVHDRGLQECALNAIWTLTNESTHEEVRKTDKLMTSVREAEVSSFDEVKQAAARLLIKLQQLSAPKGNKAFKRLLSYLCIKLQ